MLFHSREHQRMRNFNLQIKNKRMLKQRLQQKLLQKLSPQQIQMIKLLEVPTLQIEQRIKKELEENPALEEGADPEAPAAMPTPRSASDCTSSCTIRADRSACPPTCSASTGSRNAAPAPAPSLPAAAVPTPPALCAAEAPPPLPMARRNPASAPRSSPAGSGQTTTP